MGPKSNAMRPLRRHTENVHGKRRPGKDGDQDWSWAGLSHGTPLKPLEAARGKEQHLR